MVMEVINYKLGMIQTPPGEKNKQLTITWTAKQSNEIRFQFKEKSHQIQEI